MTYTVESQILSRLVKPLGNLVQYLYFSQIDITKSRCINQHYVGRVSNLVSSGHDILCI